MASPVGQLGGLPAHSGADTALSGANTFSQDDGVAVDSPWVTDSQASVALAGETSLPHAANSTARTSAQLEASDSALSVTGSKGTLQSAAVDLCLHAKIDSAAYVGRKRKAEGAQHAAHSSTLDDAAHASHATPLQQHLPSPRQVIRYTAYSLFQVGHRSDPLLVTPSHNVFGLTVSQEHGSSADAAAATSEPPGQSPLPHCNLPSIKRRPSAATSVEAVQQGGDEDDAQGDYASNRVGGGVTSLPATSSARHPKPTSLYGVLPIAPGFQERSALSNKAADRSADEHPHSVAYDSACPYNAQLPAFQQLSGMSHTQRSHKLRRSDSGEAMLAPQSSLLAAECSGASASPHSVSQHDLCQAAAEATQQATIEEVSLQLRHKHHALSWMAYAPQHFIHVRKQT